MARIDTEQKELIVEQVQNDALKDISQRNPMVLSCGGIFIPRPRQAGPKDEFYRILSVPNSKEPTKLVTGGFPRNLLQEVLHKESMN